MGAPPATPDTAGSDRGRRLYVYNGGFLTQPRVRRILELSGYELRLGLPGPEDMIGVWGMSQTAHRGETVARRRDAPILRVEDAWLRSLHPGSSGEPPIGLTLDAGGVHYDAAQPSTLETLLATEPFDDTVLLDRARGAIARLREAHLTKYSAVDPVIEPPEPGYVLVIDQTKDDASVTACGADRNRFLEMLFTARENHPGARIVIKSHPAVVNGDKTGYFRDEDLAPHVTRMAAAISPWVLLDGAIAVYTVSSQLGFEAIFAGHKPYVFGQPFYAGWGLTEDAFPVLRRQRRLTRAQLFAGAAILYPKWYDPYHDRLCRFEDAAEAMAAIAGAWRDDRLGWVASGMSMWKRPALQRFFGKTAPVLFEEKPEAARATERPWMVWASKAALGQADATRVEDGFLRSHGLGAELVPPLSLVLDDLGIYYDATRPSRLEQLITDRATLRPDQATRARTLIARLRDTGVSKYNLPPGQTVLPQAQVIMLVGQVEDDASLRLGSDSARTNRALIEAARAARPGAMLVYKPHPDVVAGLRDGGPDITNMVDLVLSPGDATALLDKMEEVWTISSLLGFEALVRGARVVTLGAPFYAGWGLTEDHGQIPPRRRAEPTLEGLVHAVLIDYPRYLDPETGLACPVEVTVDRLARGKPAESGLRLRMLAKLQGFFASQTHLWRRKS
ncbi:MAG: capsular polysaccharide biosynthesis protein [Pseudomonadota bacterium]